MTKLNIGAMYVVNASKDLMMDADLKHLIGTQVEFVKVTKSGLAYVKQGKRFYSLPQYNLSDKDG